MSHEIEFQDVHRSFAGNAVLRGLTFGVRAGEIYALLGRNGAGKTTAMRILLGFLEPHAGTATILGRDSLALRPSDRARIGLVTEGHKLYAWMRVRDVLDFEEGTRKRFDRAYAEHHLRRLELPFDKRVKHLSRGQRATVALLVAMAGRPDVLVMDDPAMGLDAVMRREFLDAMIELLGEEGRSVLFSSHILTDVERIADRVGILHEGGLIVDATVDDLKRRVQRRFARFDGRVPAFDDLPGVLRAQPKRDGFDLLLLDLDAEGERRLAAMASVLSPPAVPTLEEIFVDLTRRAGDRALVAEDGR
jgi:ABC-2 type transport system ATP-binding protein